MDSVLLPVNTRSVDLLASVLSQLQLHVNCSPSSVGGRTAARMRMIACLCTFGRVVVCEWARPLRQ